MLNSITKVIFAISLISVSLAGAAFAQGEDRATLDHGGDNVASGCTFRRPFNFQDTCKSSYTIARNVGGQYQWWSLTPDGAVKATSFGSATADSLVPADYTGDNLTDIAVHRNDGSFFKLASESGAFSGTGFGLASDEKIQGGDFDGDGKADVTVVRTSGSNKIWYVLNSATSTLRSASWGSSSMVVLPPADYTGDNRADYVVLQTNTSPATYWVMNSQTGATSATGWGNWNTDYYVTGDFVGDTRTDFAVWRGVSGGTGVWWILENGGSGSIKSVQFGIAGTDRAVRGDFDGDSYSDIAVYRPSTSTWYSLDSSTGTFRAANWGISSDVVVNNVGVR